MKMAAPDGVHTINCKEVFMDAKADNAMTQYNKLNVEKKQLTRQYYAFKDEVKEVEQIRRNVYSIVREENGREQPTRNHDIE